MQLTRITIYGAGLIGGSLALALKRAFPNVHIAGVDKPSVLERARRLNMIDAAGPAPADLSILAAPVGEILRLLDQLKHDAIVTDVGSTKTAICKTAERLSIPFVGGHPMAGLEHSGPDAASADLFQNAPYFLCSVKSTPVGAMELMRGVAEAIGAIPHEISPEEHDRLVARISHLPQIVSTVLAGQTSADRELAGPGLRSMTRLAASPFHVWRDILKTSGFLPHELQSFIDRLQRILDSMEAGAFDEIETLFTEGDEQSHTRQ